MPMQHQTFPENKSSVNIDPMLKLNNVFGWSVRYTGKMLIIGDFNAKDKLSK